jgi:alkanesulfonate monooxygenase SsuD/methylene tetrahydromethanopterin reductase-like flavin-dependent oxidoreductase (luciferase family)
MERRDGRPVVIGVDSFGEMTLGADGRLLSQPQNIRELVAEGVLAEERGFPEITRAYFEHEVEYGSLYVGSPDTVARRIARTMTTLDATRFDVKYGMGPMPHAVLMENIRLLGTEVAPRVREHLAAR